MSVSNRMKGYVRLVFKWGWVDVREERLKEVTENFRKQNEICLWSTGTD